MDSWTLTATEPARGLLYLGNGYLGTSLHWDGGMLADSKAAPCYIRGVYNGSGEDGIDRLATIPPWSLLRYAAPGTVEQYRRDLDLRRGVLCTSFVLQEDRGRVHVLQTLFLSRHDRHTAALRVTLTPEFDGTLTFHTDLAVCADGDLESVDAGVDGRTLYLVSRTCTHGITVAQTLTVEEEYWRFDDHMDGSGIARVFRTDAHAGEELTLTQLVRVATSLEHLDPLRVARPDGTTFISIEAQHERAWSDLWQTDIEIEGDPEVQQFARAALFYLWSTLREGDDWSIAPMGLSSNGYNGHIFWDAETWMYPSLLVTQPEMARSCVAYRRRTLPAAQARAAANGHAGAQFPWEAAFTGEEMTPLWCDTRDFQLHITADVAIGQWWYYLTTGDRDWLRRDGFPVIRACAEYWASRVEYQRALDRYEISDVVCADEYAVHVDNDAFTNAAVRQTLLLATRAAELLGEPAPTEWRSIAERLYFPYDETNGRHLEFDGYDGQVTKQADVELLAYPLEHTRDPEQIARDLDYYETVLDPHGPAMSYSVYSIVSAQLGRAAAAYDYLLRSYVPNTRAPFFSFSETPVNDEFFFCTGAGGALQSLLFGFTGLRLREGFFLLNPILPDHWRTLRLRNLFLTGARTDIEIGPESVAVQRHLTSGSLQLILDRRSGRAKVYVEGKRTQALTVDVVDAHGVELWSGVVTAGEPIRWTARSGEEVRVRVVVDGQPAIDMALGQPIAVEAAR